MSDMRVRNMQRGWRAAVVSCVAVCAPIAATSGAVAGGESAGEVLARAQDFVEDAESVEYTADLQIGGGVGVGTLEHTAVFPSRGRSVLTLPGSATESIFIKKNMFIRGAESFEVLQGEPFTRLDADRPGAPSGVPEEYRLLERPQDLGDVLDEVESPEIVSTDANGTVLRVTFPEPERIIRATPEPYDVATADLLITTDGEPARFSLTATGPDGEVTATVDEVRWNEPVTIKAPQKADLDPVVDDAAIAAFEDTPLYQPRAIPENWELDSADVVPASQTIEGCDEVNLFFVDRAYEGDGFFDVYVFPTTCSTGPPEGSEPVEAGGYRGWIANIPDDPALVTAEIDVDGTTVQVVTDLTREQIVEILSDLVPLNLDKPPKANLSLDD